MIDYNKYMFTNKELLSTFLKGFFLYGIILYLFYQETMITLLAVPLSFIYIKKQKSSKIEDRKWQLTLQFRDAVISLSNALNSGYSIENSFMEVITDLKQVYGQESYIIQEFNSINYRIKMNQNIEDILYEFAMRSDIEDINNFSEIFSIAKRSGGDLMKIIRTTSKTIDEKIEVKREIRTLISGKKLECHIMNCVPFGILLYMNICSPGFLSVLYHNFSGQLIMTFALIVCLGAIKLSEYFTNIQI